MIERMIDPYSDRELEAMPGDLESDLVERKESLRRDGHYDVSPVRAARLGELQVERFMDEYPPAANERTAEERLAAAKMIAAVDDPVPTVAGLLVLGRRPQHFLPGAYVQFLRFAGRDWGGEVVDEARCDGPVADLMRRVDDKLIAHGCSICPLGALQQIVRNAVMHRTYDGTNAPVHVYWFDDRIEINSPGGPYGTLTPENFGRQGVIDYRNPALAEAMRVLGLGQRYGFGIPLARRELRAAGQPLPEFRVAPHRVHCTVRVRPQLA